MRNKFIYYQDLFPSFYPGIVCCLLLYEVIVKLGYVRTSYLVDV